MPPMGVASKSATMRLRKLRSWGLAMALFTLGPPPARAAGAADDSACVQPALAAIQRHYESLRDLRADFEQTTRAVAFGEAGDSTTSRGEVLIAKPGRMRWEYREPAPSLVVSDGEWLWIYDPQRKEAQRMSAATGFASGAALEFLMGRGDLARDFRVRAESCTPDVVRLELTPIAETSYERLVLVADPRSGVVSETEIYDLIGNATRIRLLAVETNLDPAPERFRFEIPDGVRASDLESGRTIE